MPANWCLHFPKACLCWVYVSKIIVKYFLGEIVGWPGLSYKRGYSSGYSLKNGVVSVTVLDTYVYMAGNNGTQGSGR